jgi:hypothetical protein
VSTETDVIVEKCQVKLKLASSLDREAEGYGEKRKDCQKRADALRAEVERLIVDPSQTEMPLDPEVESEDGEMVSGNIPETSPEPIGVTEP